MFWTLFHRFHLGRASESILYIRQGQGWYCYILNKTFRYTIFHLTQLVHLKELQINTHRSGSTFRNLFYNNCLFRRTIVKPKWCVTTRSACWGGCSFAKKLLQLAKPLNAALPLPLNNNQLFWDKDSDEDRDKHENSCFKEDVGGWIFSGCETYLYWSKTWPHIAALCFEEMQKTSFSNLDFSFTLIKVYHSRAKSCISANKWIFRKFSSLPLILGTSCFSTWFHFQSFNAVTDLENMALVKVQIWKTPSTNTNYGRISSM